MASSRSNPSPYTQFNMNQYTLPPMLQVRPEYAYPRRSPSPTTKNAVKVREQKMESSLSDMKTRFDEAIEHVTELKAAHATFEERCIRIANEGTERGNQLLRKCVEQGHKISTEFAKFMEHLTGIEAENTRLKAAIKQLQEKHDKIQFDYFQADLRFKNLSVIVQDLELRLRNVEQDQVNARNSTDHSPAASEAYTTMLDLFNRFMRATIADQERHRMSPVEPHNPDRPTPSTSGVPWSLDSTEEPAQSPPSPVLSTIHVDHPTKIKSDQYSPPASPDDVYVSRGRKRRASLDLDSDVETLDERPAQSKEIVRRFREGDLRPNGGCWTCLLRHRTCEKSHPSCQECVSADRKCYYGRPDWWYNKRAKQQRLC